MVFEFEVVVLDYARSFVPHDRSVVDEVLDRDQNAVDVERVAVRQIKVAPRHTISERAGLDDDRASKRVLAGHQIAAKSDPADRLERTGQRFHLVAHHEILDRDLSALTQNQRATAEANDADLGAVTA